MWPLGRLSIRHSTLFRPSSKPARGVSYARWSSSSVERMSMVTLPRMLFTYVGTDTLTTTALGPAFYVHQPVSSESAAGAIRGCCS